MLARYQIVRGKRPPGNPLPAGRRIDTRKHTQHCLRPSAEHVAALIENPSAAAFERFAASYRALIARRFAEDRRPFDELAELAEEEDVYLGCNCPTRWNPDVKHCHTTHALAFMHAKYPKLRVVMPARSAAATGRDTAATRREVSASGRDEARGRDAARVKSSRRGRAPRARAGRPR